jgi:hypothetical protein
VSVDRIGLAEALEALRAELGKAAENAAKKGLKFQVNQATVELEVVTERVNEGTLGLKFWVVEAEGGRSVSRGHTHRVSVSLTPLLDDKPLMTADDDVPQ